MARLAITTAASPILRLGLLLRAQAEALHIQPGAGGEQWEKVFKNELCAGARHVHALERLLLPSAASEHRETMEE